MMKLSDILIPVTEEEYFNTEDKSQIMYFKIGNKIRSLFRSDIAYIEYLMYYLSLNGKISLKGLTLDIFYNIDIEDLPTMEEQIQFVNKYGELYMSTVGYYTQMYELCREDILHNFDTFCNTFPNTNFLSLIKIKNEELFIKRILNLQFNNYEEFVTITKLDLLRPKYVLYCIYFLHVGLYLDISKSSMDNCKIILLDFNNQDLMIGLFDKLVYNKRKIEKHTLRLNAIINSSC